jgi:hypothetical protein
MPEESDELAAQFDFVKWGAELRASLSQSLAGVWLRGARAVPVSTVPTTGVGPVVSGATQRPSGSAGRLVGWSFNLPEESGGAAQVDLYDGPDANGALVASVSLIPGQSDAFEHHGIGFVYGLYVDITGTGADLVRGAVYLGATE